nr:unnamed protein product [Callosobruchus analis]
MVNRHSSHYWPAENPKWLIETRFRGNLGVNIWCGLFNGRLIGPYFCSGALTGERCLNLNFLPGMLPYLLEGIPLNERNTIWRQQDGAPHFDHRVRNYLDIAFPECWIRRSGTYLLAPKIVIPDVVRFLPLGIYVCNTV